MEELAETDPDFAPLWRKLESARAVVRSIMFMDGKRYPEEEVLEACKEDAQYQRCLARCKERYERYLKVFELFHQADGEDEPQSIVFPLNRRQVCSLSSRACVPERRALGAYNGYVTLTEYEHQIPDRGASAVLGIWCSISQQRDN